MPVPSQETEEWRYTDLSGFDLDFAPYTPGGRAENLDDVPGDVLAAAGAIGDRAGLQIQHNSEAMLTHLDPALAARASCSATSTRPPRRIPTWSSGTCTRSCRPTARSSSRCTARSAPGGTFLYVPDGRADRPAAADADVPGRGRRRRLPAHADRRRERTRR